MKRLKNAKKKGERMSVLCFHWSLFSQTDRDETARKYSEMKWEKKDIAAQEQSDGRREEGNQLILAFMLNAGNDCEATGLFSQSQA